MTIIIWHLWNSVPIPQKHIFQVGVGIKVENIWLSPGENVKGHET